eukprot:8451535-Pyramimonas_sp.AAC.1
MRGVLADAPRGTQSCDRASAGSDPQQTAREWMWICSPLVPIVWGAIPRSGFWGAIPRICGCTDALIAGHPR